VSARVVRSSKTRRAIDARTGKPVPPESVRQAERVGQRAAKLRDVGVRLPCSVQGGFSRQENAGPVRPPCADCLVAALPGGWANGWKLPGEPVAIHLSAARHVPGVPASPYACTAAPGEVSAA
jgi:hypothetical protein